MARAKKTRAPRERRVSFSVSFVLPEGASVQDARDYVRDGIVIGCRCRVGLSDPIFMLDGDTVQVRRHYATKRRTTA